MWFQKETMVVFHGINIMAVGVEAGLDLQALLVLVGVCPEAWENLSLSRARRQCTAGEDMAMLTVYLNMQLATVVATFSWDTTVSNRSLS